MEDEYKKLMKECLEDASKLVGTERITEQGLIMVAIELFKLRVVDLSLGV